MVMHVLSNPQTNTRKPSALDRLDRDALESDNPLSDVDLLELDRPLCMLLKRLAQKSPSVAALQFDVPIELAEMVANASDSKLRDLASAATLSFKPRFDTNALRTHLMNSGNELTLLRMIIKKF